MRVSAWTGLLAICAAVSGAAGAADEPDSLVAGKLVAVKPGTLVKFLAKGTFALPTAANDPTLAGASLAVFDTAYGGAGRTTFTLAAAGWRGLGNPAGSAGYRYKGGPADPCRVVLLKPTLLKAICKGSAITLAPPFGGEVGAVLTAGSASKRYCASFAGTEVKNDAALAKRKDAPAPAACPTADLGTRPCALANTTTLTGFPFPTLPYSVSADGSFTLTCGTPGPDGVAPCACDVVSIGPVVFPSIGEICVAPADPCPGGAIQCTGGDAADLDLVADHDIGPCTSNADCAAACDAQCSGMGATYEVRASGCEGFCQGGGNDEGACTADTQCPGGTCVGSDPPLHGGRCNCQCGGSALGAAGPAGTLTCQLSARFTFEFGADGVCGDGAGIDWGPLCVPLTTAASTAVLTHSPYPYGPTIPSGGPETIAGAPVSCASFQTGSLTGLEMVGAFGLFDRATGDILSRNALVCQ